MRTLQLSRTATAAHMTDKPARPVPHHLRSRAEQVEDELAAEQPDPAPTVRRLPRYDGPLKPRASRPT
jgi:hypothetical protein